jgi:hypothetical protein
LHIALRQDAAATVQLPRMVDLLPNQQIDQDGTMAAKRKVSGEKVQEK